MFCNKKFRFAESYKKSDLFFMLKKKKKNKKKKKTFL